MPGRPPGPGAGARARRPPERRHTAQAWQGGPRGDLVALSAHHARQPL